MGPGEAAAQEGTLGARKRDGGEGKSQEEGNHVLVLGEVSNGYEI